jgi:hypothetical protein
MARCRHNPSPHCRRRPRPLMRRDLERRLSRAKYRRPRYLGAIGKQRTAGGRYAPASNCTSSSRSASE